MKNYFCGEREFFPEIPAIPYEGPQSKNPLAFRYYEADRVVAGKTMKEHLRFGMAYWHSFCSKMADPFGAETRTLPWERDSEGKTLSPAETAVRKADAVFEVCSKLHIPFYCFHDRDAAPEGASLAEGEKNLRDIAKILKERQEETGIRLLWNTANLFSHPRYMNGGISNPDFSVLACAGAQVKAALDVNVELGGLNYVFWGGREGYMSLLNTDMKREKEHLARFYRMVVDYGRKIGFQGTFLLEPKPMEPSKHQYDHDVETCIGFLRAHGLEKDFKLNIEGNHSTLAGHSAEHELQTAADEGMLGSLDINRGDGQNGWDTDQFLTDIGEAVRTMAILLNAGGIGSGGLNFDAKLRRNSTDGEDLFLAHIGSMDTMAAGLLIADRMVREGTMREHLSRRYAEFDKGRGAEFEKGRLSLEDLHREALSSPEPGLKSGKQEQLENLFNRYLLTSLPRE